MRPIYPTLWLLATTFSAALPSPTNSTVTTNTSLTSAPSITPELIYQFSPLMSPENAILRPNGQLLVTCLTCNTLSQLDPSLGPDQARRTVLSFPEGVINVLGIDSLAPDVYVVAVGQLDILDLVNLSSPNPITGPTGVWLVDLREYTAPAYNSSLVKAHRVGGGSLAGLFDGLAVINAEKGLVAATDAVEGDIWLIDIEKGVTSVLATGLVLPSKDAALSSLLLANGLKYRDRRLYFTASLTGTYGYVPVDPETGRATGPVQVVYDYGFSLDDFGFGPTGNAYFTTFAKPDGGILRRAAGTADGQSGTEMVLSYFATNSVIPRDVDGNCELLMTVFLQFQVVRATIPGPC